MLQHTRDGSLGQRKICSPKRVRADVDVAWGKRTERLIWRPTSWLGTTYMVIRWVLHEDFKQTDDNCQEEACLSVPSMSIELHSLRSWEYFEYCGWWSCNFDSESLGAIQIAAVRSDRGLFYISSQIGRPFFGAVQFESLKWVDAVKCALSAAAICRNLLEWYFDILLQLMIQPFLSDWRIEATSDSFILNVTSNTFLY